MMKSIKKLFVFVAAFCLAANVVGYGSSNNFVYSINAADGDCLNYFKNDDDRDRFRKEAAKERQDRINSAYTFNDVLKQDLITTENLILEKFEASKVNFRNIEELKADGSADAATLRTLAHFLVDYDEKQVKQLDLDIKEPFNFESAVNFLKNPTESQESRAFTIQRRDYMTQPVVGCASLQLFQAEGESRKVVSFGIFLDKQMFKKGIGTETMTELVDRVINCVDVDECYMAAYKENEASLKLFNKVFDRVIELNPGLKLKKICESIEPSAGVDLQQIRLVKTK